MNRKSQMRQKIAELVYLPILVAPKPKVAQIHEQRLLIFFVRRHFTHFTHGAENKIADGKRKILRSHVGR